MSAAARQGESGGSCVQVPPRPTFPPCSILQRIALACALWLGLLGLPAAAASSLYHCTGAGGEAVFSNTTAGYTQCKLIGTFASGPHRRSSVPATARAATHAGGSATRRPNPGGGRTFQDLQATVMSTARVVAERSSDTSFAAIGSSVQTTAQALDAGRQVEAANGVHGRWNYREATAAATPPIAAGPADRVLRGAVYRVVRGDGSVEYTNVPPAGKPGHAVTMLFTYLASCVACNLHSPIDWNHVHLNLDAYAQTIREASAESGVNEAFLRAIIHAESAFNPHALSLKGAQGLMQLMPATAGDMGVHDAFDAEQNIRGGARYLAMLLRSFHGSEQLAAAAYNAGAGAVQRYGGVPPYAETQVYVQRVGVLRKRYSEFTHAPLASVPAATAGGF